MVLLEGKVSATDGRLWYQLGKLQSKNMLHTSSLKERLRGDVLIFSPLEVHPVLCCFTEAVWTGRGHGFEVHQLNPEQTMKMHFSASEAAFDTNECESSCPLF